MNGSYALHEAAAGIFAECENFIGCKGKSIAKNASNNTALDVAMNTMMTMNNPSQLIDTVDLLNEVMRMHHCAVDLSSPDKQGSNPA